MTQKVISVIGPSGGVGKSTIVKELAIAYANTYIHDKPLSVCIIDANLGIGSQQALFRLAPKYFLEDWIDDLKHMLECKEHPEILKHYDWDSIEKYLSRSDEYQLFILPTCADRYFNGSHAPSDITIDQLTLIVLTLKKFFDVILIDTGNNLHEVTIGSVALSDKSLLLLTDERRCLSSIGKLKQVLRSQRISFGKLMPILNQYPDKRCDQIYSMDEINQVLLETQIAHVLSWDKRTWTFNNICQSLMLQKNAGKLGEQLNRLAKDLIPDFQ